MYSFFNRKFKDKLEEVNYKLSMILYLNCMDERVAVSIVDTKENLPDSLKPYYPEDGFEYFAFLGIATKDGGCNYYLVYTDDEWIVYDYQSKGMEKSRNQLYEKYGLTKEKIFELQRKLNGVSKQVLEELLYGTRKEFFERKIQGIVSPFMKAVFDSGVEVSELGDKNEATNS